jgi:hypothetical protein
MNPEAPAAQEKRTCKIRPATAEQLCAAFILDTPVPVRHLYGIYGSRTTFFQWRKMGLCTRAIKGVGPTVIPSEFKAFLADMREKGTEDHE